jgi:acyl-CoA synthetase (NDP forming)
VDAVPSDAVVGNPATWLRHLLLPSSVAIIGASADATKPSGVVQRYLQTWGYAGKVYPVNPGHECVQGVASFKSARDLPPHVDLAIVMVPAGLVPAALADCAAANIPVAVIESAGFSESGAAGELLEREIISVCDRSGIRVIGPNSNGVVSVRSRLTGSFMTGLDTERFALTDGGISLISQSGAIGAFIFNMAQSSGLGVGTFISTGNETNLGFEEVITALVADSGTDVVLGYIEGLRSGASFVAAARKAAVAGKPLAILKVGRTKEGAEAAALHTASLAGSDRVYGAVFRQLGVIRVRSLAELVDVGRVLKAMPRPVGTRITVVTMSGGAGILFADRAIECGLELANWDSEWQQRLHEFLPSYATTANPIDGTGAILTDALALAGVMTCALEHPETDIVVLILGNGERYEAATATALLKLASEHSKQFLVVWPGGSGAAVNILNNGGIPAFADPVSCADVVSAVATRQVVRKGAGRLPVPYVSVWRRVLTGETEILDEVRSKGLLATYGVPVCREIVLAPGQDLDISVARLGLPLVAKLHSPGLTHKTEVGGVRKNLFTYASVVQAVNDLLGRATYIGLPDADVVLAEQVDIALELFVGATVDPTFGPLVTFGLGGVFAEALDETCMLLADFSDDEFEAALRRPVFSRMFSGFRGLPAVNSEQLLSVIRSVSSVILDEEAGVRAIDVNPLAVSREGRIVAVDASVQVVRSVQLLEGMGSQGA